MILRLGVGLSVLLGLCACASTNLENASAPEGSVPASDPQVPAADTQGDDGAPTADAGKGEPDVISKDAGRSSDGGSGPDSGVPLPDPNLDGPFAYAERDGTMRVAATGNDVPVHAAYPTGSGKFPLVLVARGFQLPASQYRGYVRRLATFGYVALTVEYATPLTGQNNPAQAAELLSAIDWAKADSTFGQKVDDQNVGLTGHSLGGKVALYAAARDPRVKASIVLDPVDGGFACSPPRCADVSAMMPKLHIPTAFLGETTDATGPTACAPAAENFTTFYAQANSPSLQVTVAGANHMSFLDDVSSCGTLCSACGVATTANAEVVALSRAYVTAFYERYLRGLAGYDSYLTGAIAQQRYVVTRKAAIVSK